jgi:hypothetical protein
MELLIPNKIMIMPSKVKLGKKYVVIGDAGRTPYDDMLPDHQGKIVTPWRKCFNQDTIICKTEDGIDLWVDNDGLCEISDLIEFQEAGVQ